MSSVLIHSETATERHSQRFSTCQRRERAAKIAVCNNPGTLSKKDFMQRSFTAGRIFERVRDITVSLALFVSIITFSGYASTSHATLPAAVDGQALPSLAPML